MSLNQIFARQSQRIWVLTKYGTFLFLAMLLSPWEGLAGPNALLDVKFMEACQNGDLAQVRAFLQQGADVDARFGDLRLTALMYAAEGRRREVARLLMEKGANVHAADKDGKTTLMYAFDENGSVDIAIVRQILDKGADINARTQHGWTALMYAAGTDDIEVVQLLVDRGANVNSRTELGRTPLMRAVAGGNLAIVKLLLDKGADINVQDACGVTALGRAVVWNLHRVAELLKRRGGKGSGPGYQTEALLSAVNFNDLNRIKHYLDKGVNINVKSCIDGSTPLMMASYRGHLHVLQLLLGRGADVNAKGFYGQTALMIAAGSNNDEAAELLLQKGAKVNDKNEHGSTPLMCAASSGNYLVAQVLLNHGANVNEEDNDGRTALNRAQELPLARASTELVRLLKEHEAK